MSTNMPITIRSRLHFNHAPFSAFGPHKRPPAHMSSRRISILNRLTVLGLWLLLDADLLDSYFHFTVLCAHHVLVYLYLAGFLPSLNKFTMYLTTP
jgi:hypothetical protein